MQPLRAAFLTSADSWRGSGVSFLHLAKGLATHGWATSVLTTNDEVSRRLLDEGIHVVEVTRGRGEVRRLRAILHSLGAGVLMTDRPHDLRVGALATVGTPVALVSRYNLSSHAPPHDLVTRLAYHLAVRETVFLTEAARARVLGRAPFMSRAPVSVIHEGIDLDEFQPSPPDAAAFRRTYGLADEAILLAVGALSPEKRYDFVFSALVALGAGAPPLVVCGEGAQQSSLRGQAAALGLDVRFLGLLPRSSLRGAYSASAALVHGCAVETFGLAVLEAMACGCPVASVAGGALPEVVGTDGSCGILTDPAEPLELSAAIASLLGDPDRAAAMGASARARATDRFSLAAMIGAYDRTLSQRHGKA